MTLVCHERLAAGEETKPVLARMEVVERKSRATGQVFRVAGSAGQVLGVHEMLG